MAIATAAHTQAHTRACAHTHPRHGTALRWQVRAALANKQNELTQAIDMAVSQLETTRETEKLSLRRGITLDSKRFQSARASAEESGSRAIECTLESQARIHAVGCLAHPCCCPPVISRGKVSRAHFLSRADQSV